MRTNLDRLLQLQLIVYLSDSTRGIITSLKDVCGLVWLEKIKRVYGHFHDYNNRFVTH